MSKTEKGFSCGIQKLECILKSKTGNIISWNCINILDEQVRGTKVNAGEKKIDWMNDDEEWNEKKEEKLRLVSWRDQ